MEHLALRDLDVSSTLLVDACKTMSHMTFLDLRDALNDRRSDDILMAISTGMPQLEVLDIIGANVSSRAIRYLLPTEEPPRRGCLELRIIGLYGIKCIDVDILKDFIICLPKLQYLAHLLTTTVLADLTDEEARAGLRCMELLPLPGSQHGWDFSLLSNKLRYDILHKAPETASTCNIRKVKMYLKGHAHGCFIDRVTNAFDKVGFNQIGYFVKLS